MKKKLGQFYYELAVKQEMKEQENSEKQAYELYKKAAELNHPKSLVKLGNYYEDMLTDEALDKAIECYMKAMDLDEPLGYESMGLLYHMGLGVHQSNIDAYKLYKIAKTPLAEMNMDLLEAFFYDEIESEVDEVRRKDRAKNE